MSGNRFYDLEGMKVIDKYKKQMMQQPVEGQVNYGQPNVIWTHPKTGGKLFCGDITAA